MSANVNDLLAEVEAVAAALGMPVDVNRQLDFASAELPRLVVWHGGEETSDNEDLGPAGWAEYVKLTPKIEILFREDDPASLANPLKTSWSRSATRSGRATGRGSSSLGLRQGLR